MVSGVAMQKPSSANRSNAIEYKPGHSIANGRSTSPRCGSTVGTDAARVSSDPVPSKV